MFSDISTNKVYKNFINGQWVESKNPNLIEITSPLDGSLVGKVPAMSKEEVDFAISCAKKSQVEWKCTPLSKRAEILYKVASLLDEHANTISEIMLYETCKDKKSSVNEVLRTADLIRFTADISKSIQGESMTGDSFPGFSKSKIAFTTREPLGVVLAISPFNYPINLAASKIAPALVAGNSVVLKSATQGAISAMYLVKVFEEAGIPKGILNTVTGFGREIGDYIVSHKDIDFINFTGSTGIGQRIGELAGMKPILMELGGKDSAIVLEDADLSLAADNIIAGAFSYSGQRCTAVKRVLVMDTIADTLSTMLKERVEKLKAGNPITEDVTIVPLIDNTSADFVMSLIDDSVAKGAKLLAGGNRNENLIYPTLIDNVTTDMKLAWEEPFGPVLPIIRVKDKDEAIKISNQSEFGLQASVFTQNINEAFYVSSKLEVGTVQINSKTERGPDHFPFLGVKSSGVGVQGVKYSIEAMTRVKSVVLNIK